MTNILKNLLTIFVTTLIGLILGEIILRIAGISYPVFYTYDELRGRALSPYKEGWQRNEGEAYVRINSLGYRDIEHFVEKPPNTFRIAVLGDSFTEARQVALENTFVSYLQHHLNMCPALVDKSVEVFNFGVSGYGTTQELLTLRHHGWQFSPDMVLLAVWSGNDITDNSKKFPGDQLRPYYILKNSELVLDNSWKSPWIHFFYEIVHYSRLMEVINYVIRKQKFRSLIEQKRKVKTIAKEPGLNNNIYSPPKNPAWQEAWLITEKLFSQIHKETQEHNAIFVLAILPTSRQVHPNAIKRKIFQKQLGVEDLFYPDRRIRTYGEKEGFLVITLAERLQRIATEKAIFLHGFKNTAMGTGHWNETGHRFAGELLVRDLCEKIFNKK
ncbi:MAG: SGNH/GDSL hydrolase family protein [Thioploca sp.]|nr:SGNH/GDSL hydrolase family protein [Thioploca sp.]